MGYTSCSHIILHPKYIYFDLTFTNEKQNILFPFQLNEMEIEYSVVRGWKIILLFTFKKQIRNEGTVKGVDDMA